MTVAVRNYRFMGADDEETWHRYVRSHQLARPRPPQVFMLYRRETRVDRREAVAFLTIFAILGGAAVLLL
jgi:hypothetical protein